MALRKKGTITPTSGAWYSSIVGPGVAAQPGASLIYKTDGVVEGSITFECDEANARNLPRIGTPHPEDRAAILHQIERTRQGLRKIQAVCHFHGIATEAGDNTRPTIEYPGGADQVDIRAHPNFSDLAGTPEDGKNGARWVDPVTREESTDANAEFDGWQDPIFNKEFYGLETFFVHRPLIYRTYWSRRPPVLKEGCVIVNSIPGYDNPPGIVNWLLLDTPFTQVANNSYRITEQYKGSPAPGWNPAVYNKA
jgi:hypothetical protein